MDSIPNADYIYEDFIPHMYAIFGAGTILKPATSIGSDKCKINKITMDADGKITIFCNEFDNLESENEKDN